MNSTSKHIQPIIFAPLCLCVHYMQIYFQQLLRQQRATFLTEDFATGASHQSRDEYFGAALWPVLIHWSCFYSHTHPICNANQARPTRPVKTRSHHQPALSPTCNTLHHVSTCMIHEAEEQTESSAEAAAGRSKRSSVSFPLCPAL